MREIRRRIFFVTVILLAIGVVMIYSASGVFAYERLHDSAYYLKRHLFYLFLGMFVFYFFLQWDYSLLRKYSRLLIMISFLLLIAVLIPGIGQSIGGARRWFKFGIFSFQPSELAKFSLLVYTADFFVRKKNLIKSNFYNLIPLMLVTFLMAGIILIQPDMGTAFLVGVILLIFMIVFGVGLRCIFNLILISLPILFIAIFSTPYRRKRILAFLDPWADPRGTGFQIVQSLVAFGSGGILGRGLGQSRQKLLYLPAAHTDFIFSILGEELGLLGALLVIILFGILFWEAFKIPFRIQDEFGQFLSLGIISILAIQVLVNIGVTVGVLPTKGLPLPFISYGGSALIFNLAYVALLLNIAREKKRIRWKEY
ncbi:MAG: putative lipid II flippase FtsW [Candidatus Omnitrophica bacterium]|nr:putative lipid II flippase FtsW [Candidatus Omnitrophota bacterium]